MFNFFKKKNSNLIDAKAVIKVISRIISHNDSIVIDEINNLLENKEDYIKNNDRGIDESFDGNALSWFLMVDTLIKYGYVCERDWKDEFDDFIYFLSNLKTFDLEINTESFNKDAGIVKWCEVIDKTFEPKCIGCIDIDSDSYVLFISSIEEIEDLKKLAASISKKIDYAKNC